MPPKASRATAGHDDAEVKATSTEKKNGHGHTNGKMRRIASQTGSNLKDVQNAASLPTPAVEATASVPAANPSVSLILSRRPPHKSSFMRACNEVHSSDVFVLHRSNGPPLTAKSSTVIVANTISRPQPPTQATTVPGS